MDGLFDIGIVSFVFAPLAVTVALLLCLWWNRVKDSRATLGTPGLLLDAAVRGMPEERREWGAAMLAELAQLRHPFTRWRFALGCARVALLAPRKGGLLQTIMNDKTKRIVITFGAAALISLILLAPFAFLQLRYGSHNYSRFPIELFGALWLLGAVFLITVAPIVGAARAGDSLLAHPVTLLFRLVFLALIALMWGGIVNDQIPCFLGVPNCD
jgi:hypothetical protein